MKQTGHFDVPGPGMIDGSNRGEGVPGWLEDDSGLRFSACSFQSQGTLSVQSTFQSWIALTKSLTVWSSCSTVTRTSWNTRGTLAV